ncbi:MAG: ARMT1-like domain-containing protein [Chloroflexota bacterium]|nr:ARMT1-like domain-containing protein [Chloroflexota bacterium]MDE2907805.1 ARMT1-like domain-containing protein [Chloroflexota bacterium]
MNKVPKRPAPIRTDQSNAFAHNTMRVRLPAIIDETIASNSDYPASITQRLRRLRDDLVAGARIKPLSPDSAIDAAAWACALERQGKIAGSDPTWHNVEWFFAETYTYRCLIETARWRESGRDPFLPKKLEELHGDALWRLIEGACEPLDSPNCEVRRAVEFALWGNRIDLSYAPASERGAEISADDLLVDDREALLDHLSGTRSSADGFKSSQPVYIVADNTGSELAMDLALSDCLLRHVSERVVICLKTYPTFVSDATPQDVWMLMREMERRGHNAAALAKRLRAAWGEERLRFLPHPFWTSCRFLWDLPADLASQLKAARLVVIKGDANYRRTVGDCLWAPQTPFAEVVDYLDAPVLCLRTLKSDPVVGLPTAETAEELDRIDRDWRVNGKRGVIQFKAQSSKRQ